MNYWEKRDAFKRLENDGVKIQIEEYPGWYFHVRQSSPWNPHFQRAMVRVAQRREAQDLVAREKAPGYAATAADQALNEDLTRDAFAEGCIAGWEGVTDREGKPLTYSPAAAAEFLEHFADVYRALLKVASNPAMYAPRTAEQNAKDAAGNLPPASGSNLARGGTSSKRRRAVTGGGRGRRAKS